MRLPAWEELESVEEQLGVLEWPLDKPLFVAGPPGSGKTVLAVRRAQMIAEAGLGTLIVSYNRMLRRLINLLDQRLEAKTMHGHVGPDYRQRAGKDVPTLPHDSHAFIWNEMMRVLNDMGVGPNRAHLVVDEGQDLDRGFFVYASRHISQVLSVFADDDQALRDQQTTLEQIKSAVRFPDDPILPILLTQNHRNTPEIARLAEHFHDGGRLPAATVQRRAGERPRLSEMSSLEAIVERVANWRTNQGGSIGIIVSRNDECGQPLHDLLRQRLPESRVDFYRGDRRNEGRINVLEAGVTVLNKESVKGQEFDSVFVLELNRFLPCQNDSEKRGVYMMCSRARDHLWLICGPGGSLTQAVEDALPGPEILERV